MKRNTPRWELLGTVMVALTVLLSGAFGLMSQEKTAAEILVNSQKLVAVGAAERISFAIRLGKPMDNFYGAQDILEQVCENSDKILAVWLSDEDNAVLYSFPADFEASGYALGEGENYVKYSGDYYCELPVDGAGAICLLLDGSATAKWVDAYIRLIAVSLPIAATAAYLVLRFLAGRLGMGKKAVACVMLASQICFTVFAFFFFQDSYYNALGETAEIVGRIVDSDVSKLTVVGISPEEFVGFDDYLRDISDNVPEFTRIQTEMPPDEPHMRLECGQLELYGVVDQSIIRGTLTGGAIDTVILTAASIFLMLEFLFFTGGGIRAAESRQDRIPAVRFLFFALYAGASMCMSFVAAVSYRFAEGSALDAELAVGVPVTVEMIAGLLAIALSGRILLRLGVKNTLFLCVFVCGTGAVLSGLSVEIFLFTAARAVAGFGFALITITGRIMAASQPDSESRSQMLSNLAGGTMIGFCCGAVIGGLLSDRFGFSAVFFFSAATILLCSPLIRKALPSGEAISGESFSPKKIYTLMKSPGVVPFLLLIVLPIYAAGGFVSYGIPLYGSLIGLNSAVISALIMVNNLVAAYLAPYTTRIMQKVAGPGRSMCFYGALTAAALFLAAFVPTLPVIVGVAIFLGVADSFGLVLLIEVFTGYAKGSDAMIGMTLTGKAGQAATPTITAAGGGTPVFLAAAVSAGTLVYTLLFIRERRRQREPAISD